MYRSVTPCLLMLVPYCHTCCVQKCISLFVDVGSVLSLLLCAGRRAAEDEGVLQGRGPGFAMLLLLLLLLQKHFRSQGNALGTVGKRGRSRQVEGG